MKLLLKKRWTGEWILDENFLQIGKNGSRILETRTDISKGFQNRLYIDDVKCEVQEIRKSLIGKDYFRTIIWS